MRLLVAGDLCPQGKSEEFLAGAQAEAFWGDILKLTKVHDLNIVNLECPLTSMRSGIKKQGPHLQSDPHCAGGIRAGGFNIVSLANNHILDMGDQGLCDTLAACRDAGLEWVGAGPNLAEATQPLVLQVGDIRIAILAFAEAEFSIATNKTAGAWPLDLIDNYGQIQAVRSQSDFILVILHGGNEHYSLPSPRLLKTCHFLVDAGANAVICHHSHIASGMETYKNAPIFYGLGNFLFDRPISMPSSWYTGYLVSLTLDRSEIIQTELIPYHQTKSETGISLMMADEREYFLRDINRLSDIILDPLELTDRWEKFCQKNRGYYLSRLISKTKFEDWLWDRKILHPRMLKKRLPDLLNVVRCQAHYDVILEVLKQLNKEF